MSPAQDYEDLPQHPGIARGWRLNREMATRLHLPGPGDNSEGNDWASRLATRVRRVLLEACCGNRSSLHLALTDLGALAIAWADAVKRRGL